MSDKRLIKSIARLRKALEKELSERASTDPTTRTQDAGSRAWVQPKDFSQLTQLLASHSAVGVSVTANHDSCPRQWQRTRNANSCRKAIVGTTKRSIEVI